MTKNTTDAHLAPELQTSAWLNTPQPLTLQALRGKVIVLHAFQMLCPGCVQFGIPLAQRMHQEFDPDRVVVIGLHTVFEHHSVMNRDALEVFIHEYKLHFPIGIDTPDGQQGIPLTMRAYRMQGTPSVILIDKTGHLRFQELGHVSDLMLGFSIGTLLSEESDTGAMTLAAGPVNLLPAARDDHS